MNDLHGEVKIGNSTGRLTLGRLRTVWITLKVESFEKLWETVSVQRNLPVLILVCAAACDEEIDTFCEKNPDISLFELTEAATRMLAPLYLGPDWEKKIEETPDETEDEVDPTSAKVTRGGQPSSE